MTGELILLDASQGDVTLTEDALCVSVQGATAEVTLIVPDPTPNCALLLVNNPGPATVWVKTANGNPAPAYSGRNTFILVDSGGNAQLAG
jgi:hypothetical protein